MSETAPRGPLSSEDLLSARTRGEGAAGILDEVAGLLQGAPAQRVPQESLTVLDGVVAHAVELIGRVDWASVTVVRGRTAQTIASSHSKALQADRIQYQERSGPCLDAAVQDSVFVSGDIAHDRRWPTFGRRVHLEVGVNSVLAYRLVLLDDQGSEAALNLYSRAPHAFDDRAIEQGTHVATECALLVSAHLANDRADNLLVALSSNREIGIAIGVLMNEHKITQEQAFLALRVASQDTNRKLIDVARDVVETGSLPARHRRITG